MSLKGCIDQIIFKVWSESGEFINQEKHPLANKTEGDKSQGYSCLKINGWYKIKTTFYQETKKPF